MPATKHKREVQPYKRLYEESQARLAHRTAEAMRFQARVAELEASEAQLALVLEQQDRTLHRYRAALEKIAYSKYPYLSTEMVRVAREAINQ